MKKTLIALVALLFLTACGSGSLDSKLEKVGELSKDENTVVLTQEDGTVLTYDKGADSKIVYVLASANSSSKVVKYYPEAGLVEFEMPGKGKDGNEDLLYCIFDAETQKSSELSPNNCNSTDQGISEAVITAYDKLLTDLDVTQEKLVEYYESQFED